MLRNRLDSLRSFWANLNPFLRFLIAVGLIGGVGLLTARPAYREFKKWRMDRNLTAAGRAVEESRMQEARDLSLAVLRAGSPDIEAFRILEKSTAALGDPRHQDVAHALISHPDGTESDRYTGFLGIVMDAPLSQVGYAWASLPEDLRTEEKFALAFSRRLHEEMRLNEALQVILAVPKEKQNTSLRQTIARILIATSKREGIREAQRMIADGIAKDPESTTSWLDVFEEIPFAGLVIDVLPPIRDSLIQNSHSSPGRLLLARTRISLASLDDADKRNALIQEAIGKSRQSSPVPLARLLADLGLHDLLYQNFPPDSNNLDPDLLEIIIQSALETSDWKTLTTWLDSHGKSLAPYQVAAYRTIIAHHAADTQAATIAWREAIDAAKRTPKPSHTLLKLHKIATKAGLTSQAETAMIDAIRTRKGPLPLYDAQRDLIQSLSQSGKDKTMLEVCAIYLTLEPANPMLLTQYAYLACVHEIVDPARLMPPLEALSAAFPNELPIHAALATVLLAQERYAEASAALAPFDLANRELSPNFLIVHLATEILNGRLSPTDDAVARFPWSSLQPAERKKFASLVRLPIPPSEDEASTGQAAPSN